MVSSTYNQFRLIMSMSMEDNVYKQSLSSLDRYGHGNSDMQLQKEGDRRLVLGLFLEAFGIDLCICIMDSAPTAAANRRVHEIAYRFRDADKADGEEIDSSMHCGLEFLLSNNWRPIRFTETVAYAPNYACSFSHLLQQVTKHALSERWLIGAAALTISKTNGQ
uniref:Uncharacterized protein n=1 Tax=Oryza glumipatula TaxID=40148 RepID=A0A0E0AFE8_9ORYZ